MLDRERGCVIETTAVKLTSLHCRNVGRDERTIPISRNRTIGQVRSNDGELATEYETAALLMSS